MKLHQRLVNLINYLFETEYREGPDVSVVDAEGVYKIRVYQDSRKDWRWKFLRRNKLNNEWINVAQGPRKFKRANDCVDTVKALFGQVYENLKIDMREG